MPDQQPIRIILVFEQSTLHQPIRMPNDMTPSQEADWNDEWYDRVTLEYLKEEDLKKLRKKWQVTIFSKENTNITNICLGLP